MSNQQQDRLFEEICAQNQNFDHYEKQFQEVLLELENDDVLETFRREYESLHTSFVKCHEGEKRLIKKCSDLASEIASCVLKVKSAEELSAGDQTTIDQLKKEIVKAKNKVSLSKETEVTLKEKIKQLKVDIKDLEKQVDRGAAGVVGHDATISNLTRLRAELQKKLDTQKGNVVALQHEINYLQGRVTKSKEEKDAKDAELRAIRDSIDQKISEEKEQREKKDQKDRETKSIKENIARRAQAFTEGKQTMTSVNEELRVLEQTVKYNSDSLDAIYKSLNETDAHVKEKSGELTQCTDVDQPELKNRIAKEVQTLRYKQREVSGLKRDVLKEQDIVASHEKRKLAVEAERQAAEKEKENRSISVRQLLLEKDALQDELDAQRKQLEELSHERNILNKKYLRAQNDTQKQKDWLVVKANQKRNLEHQVRAYERHAQHQSEMIHQLTRESQTYETESADAAQKYNRAMEDLKLQDHLILEEQKRISDHTDKLKDQEAMLETVRKERNLYGKNYNALKNEISTMGKQFDRMLNDIKQLKEEIQSKERELVAEEAAVTRATSDRKGIEIRIEALKKKIEKREKAIDGYNSELHKLNQIIADADAEKCRQKRDHVNVMNERDILGTQLIRRNDELAHLYERIRIQQSLLKKGEAQYNYRLLEINQLCLRVAQLEEELNKLKQFASRLPDLKLLLNKSQRELSREQCRVRVLLDEADNPQNVHRFHHLEWSEPQTFELHERIRKLQKELVSKNNEVEDKDRLISEKEKLFVELKAIVARHPGPEVAEQLNVYQDSLQKKIGQMRAMKLSLKHFQEQVEQYKSRYDELNDELSQMNSEFVQQRKSTVKATKQQQILNEMLGREPNAPPSTVVSDQPYTGYVAPPRPQTEEEHANRPPLSGVEDGGIVGEGKSIGEDRGTTAEDVQHPVGATTEEAVEEHQQGQEEEPGEGEDVGGQ